MGEVVGGGVWNAEREEFSGRLVAVHREEGTN